MKRAQLRKTGKDLEPFEFERRVSHADEIGRGWNRSLPKNVLTNDMLAAYKRALDPQLMEQASNVYEKCKGMMAVVDIPHRRYKRHTKEYIIYTDAVCDQALESISKSPAKRRAEAEVRPQKVAQSSQDILRDLETLREAQEAPDFTRRPTDEAYKAANESLTAAYTHYVGSAPIPALAPDGDGGVVVQWKSGKREVRLVVPPEGEEKSYIYSRGDKTAKVDYDISGSVLAQQLRSTFAD